MKQKSLKSSLAVLFAFSLSLWFCRRQRSYHLPLLSAHTSNLKHTEFTAHLRVKIPPGRNLIYCGTFQLAWNALMKLAGGPIQVEPRLDMVQHLNTKPFSLADVDPQAVTVSVKPEKTNHRIRIKTTLEKNLRFVTPFTRLKKPMPFQVGDRKVPLPAFGLDANDRSLRARQVPQVVIAHYAGPREFTVVLKTRSSQDVLVLARTNHGPTLEATYRAVDAAVRKTGPHAARPRPSDELAVPFLNFRLEHDFVELLKKVIQNVPFRGWFFERAHQLVRLRLDEKGALLYSESNLQVACSAGPSAERRFHFDGPFLLYMRQKSSTVPYLAVWVGHPEILAGWKEQK